jgi:hypothetical protein
MDFGARSVGDRAKDGAGIDLGMQRQTRQEQNEGANNQRQGCSPDQL